MKYNADRAGVRLHKLVEDRVLTLGGVQIPYELGLLGHSDADVLLHAIIDSIFGAIAYGDIGRHFPDNDPKYKGADSLKLLGEAGNILKQKGYKILNIDSTIVAQKPKLAPYVNKMRENIASVLNIETASVSVKAKTNEGMDSTGECKAIQAYAVILVDRI